MTLVLQLTCQWRCASRRCLKYSNLPSLHPSPASYRSLSVWEDSQCCNFTSGNKNLQLHIRQQAHQIICPIAHSWLRIACIIDIQLVQPCWTCLGFITKYRENTITFWSDDPRALSNDPAVRCSFRLLVRELMGWSGGIRILGGRTWKSVLGNNSSNCSTGLRISCAWLEDWDVSAQQHSISHLGACLFPLSTAHRQERMLRALRGKEPRPW